MTEIHVGFVVDGVALGWGFFRALLLPLSVSFMLLNVLQRMDNWPSRGRISTGTLSNPITRINFRCTKLILEHKCADAPLEDSMCAGMNAKDAGLSTRRIIDCD
jgi:hypothetical protein